MSKTLNLFKGGLIPVDIHPVKEVRLGECLGNGAFGSVWLAENTHSNVNTL